MPVHVETSSVPQQGGPLPGIVEVVSPSGHVVRLTPPIDARVLMRIPAMPPTHSDLIAPTVPI
ncbi:hypothetical protein [Novosphingobium sp. FKTRR1]|uniref:hypothetical protein n=1 Tax=Novosphingobium sp. FKTRR1 TaxID=2879118 RepID=UPI001CF0D30F|nr:hypothetical protein [Novosphingobium sp. FKTRR1]